MTFAQETCGFPLKWKWVHTMTNQSHYGVLYSH